MILYYIALYLYYTKLVYWMHYIRIRSELTYNNVKNELKNKYLHILILQVFS